MKVYIIHGWTYSLDKWKPLISLLQAHRIEPIQLKVPGLTAPSQGVWDIEKYVDWLNSQIDSEAEPIIIGHSNGGRIALAYCNRYPTRLAQLILIDSAGVSHDAPAVTLKLRIFRTLALVGKSLGHLPGVKKLFYRLIGAHDYLQAPPNMKITMQNMLDADKNIDLSKIVTPTTIIWGRDDTITPLSDAHKLQQSIQKSTLEIVDGGRHAPFYTHSEQVAEIILEALK